jgi:hypothetical protein
MVVEAVNGLGLAVNVTGTGSLWWFSSMPVVASETLSAETSAQPPLQVPLSYANRSMVIFLTASGLIPARWVVSSCFRSSV